MNLQAGVGLDVSGGLVSAPGSKMSLNNTDCPSELHYGQFGQERISRLQHPNLRHGSGR